MVQSLLNDQVNYTDRRTRFPQDLKDETDLYEIELFGLDTAIAVGQVRNTKDIVYFQIYFVNDDDRATPIGVYEMKSSDYKKDGDVDISSFDQEPLLYSFANKKFVMKWLQLDESREKINKNTD